MKKIILLMLLISLLAAPALAQRPYAVGDTVSNFTLQDAQGEWVSLFDYSDRIVFLVFWTPG